MDAVAVFRAAVAKMAGSVFVDKNVILEASARQNARHLAAHAEHFASTSGQPATATLGGARVRARFHSVIRMNAREE